MCVGSRRFCSQYGNSGKEGEQEGKTCRQTQTDKHTRTQTHTRRDTHTHAAPPNCSSRCVHGACRNCCKRHCVKNVLNCAGHNFHIKDRAEKVAAGLKTKAPSGDGEKDPAGSTAARGQTPTPQAQ